MSKDHSRFKFEAMLFVVAALISAGTVGFMLTEGLSLKDAFYLCIVTISTVGYGDLHPTGTAGKVLAMLLIVMGVGTFLGVIANATDLMLNRREKRSRLEKLNMVIGTFFSEVGNSLLSRISAADENIEDIRKELMLKMGSKEEAFSGLHARLEDYKGSIDMARMDLPAVSELLLSKRDFLLRLLENPNLLEQEAFTDILWAVFHLTEELSFRQDLSDLAPSDMEHLRGDVFRVYSRLIPQWVEYMYHLKKKFPYLFSLSVRMNPFDREASPVVV